MKNIEKKDFSIMTDMLSILIVLSILAVYYYGIRAAVVIAVSVICCTVIDYICKKACHVNSDKKDFSSVITGIVIALMMPSSIPYHILIVACVFAIIIAKHAFGGYGHSIFNNAAVGFLFVSLCFSDYVLSYPKPFTDIPFNETLNPAELYPSMTKSILATDTQIVSVMDMLTGKFNGPMGTTCLLILIISAIILLYRRSISFISFATQTVIVFVFTYIYTGYNISYTLHILSSGMFIFGILFLSCDYSTIPKTKSSRFIYALVVAGLTLVFHFYAKVENAIVYAVILAAPIGIELDRRSLSFADLIEKNNSIAFKIRKKFNKNLDNVNETLNLVNDGSDINAPTATIRIHNTDEGIFDEKSDL